jgi:hypothetical protein
MIGPVDPEEFIELEQIVQEYGVEIVEEVPELLDDLSKPISPDAIKKLLQEKQAAEAPPAIDLPDPPEEAATRSSSVTQDDPPPPLHHE